MVISMTNRLLAVVIALALSGGIAAHAAQAPQRPLAPITLLSASALPAALQTAASRITESATSAIDPGTAIRSAYQRNRVSLEHLRQQASQLNGSAHPAFNQLISDDERALTACTEDSVPQRACRRHPEQDDANRPEERNQNHGEDFECPGSVRQGRPNPKPLAGIGHDRSRLAQPVKNVENRGVGLLGLARP